MLACVKAKNRFSLTKNAVLTNLTSIVTLPRCNRPSYDPDIGVVINDSKFGVCISSGFKSFQLKNNQSQNCLLRCQ